METVDSGQRSFANRGKRRRAVKRLLIQLEQIRDAEERYRDRIPENLRDASAYDMADESVDMLSYAIDSLESAY